jgi:site-specific recombinase XerD
LYEKQQRSGTGSSLRHSHASALIAAGWDIAEVSARLGHSSIETTQWIWATS